MTSNAKLKTNETAMRKAAALLTLEGIPFIKPDDYTLQFDDYSYWPRTKTLYRQYDAQALKQQGLDKIAELIRSFKHPPSPQGDRFECSL